MHGSSTSTALTGGPPGLLTTMVPTACVDTKPPGIVTTISSWYDPGAMALLCVGRDRDPDKTADFVDDVDAVVARQFQLERAARVVESPRDQPRRLDRAGCMRHRATPRRMPTSIRHKAKSRCAFRSYAALDGWRARVAGDGGRRGRALDRVRVFIADDGGTPSHPPWIGCASSSPMMSMP